MLSADSAALLEREALSHCSRGCVPCIAPCLIAGGRAQRVVWPEMTHETKRRLGLLACAVAATFALAWWIWGRREGSPSSDPVAERPTMSPAAPGIAAHPDSAAKVAPATEPAERVTVREEDPAMARLSGRCVDAAGAPLAGCTVALSGWSSGREAEAQWLRDHEALPKPMDLPRVVTKEDGRFSFSFSPL